MPIGISLAELIEDDAPLPVVRPGQLPDEAQALDVFAPDPICDVCRAAKLAESGVMATSIPAEKLHAQCRRPGGCDCGCPVSRGGRCSQCGRAQSPEGLVADANGPRCLDQPSCAEAILSGSRPASNGAAAPLKPKTTQKARTTTPSTPRVPRPKTGQPCKCECGETTGGGMYRPGHDSRHVKRLFTEVCAGRSVESALAALPTEALRAKLTKQLGG